MHILSYETVLPNPPLNTDAPKAARRLAALHESSIVKHLSKILVVVLFVVGCNTHKDDPTGVNPGYYPLQTPTLFGGKFIESPGYGLNWTNSGDNCQYELEESATQSFNSGTLIYQGSSREFTVPTNDFYYRVKAKYIGLASEWSNIVRP